MSLTVQLPQDVAAGLVEVGKAVYHHEVVHGGFADLAAYAAIFAGDSAAVVTLMTTPDVITSLARRLHRRGAQRTRWLNARGPGGEVSLRMDVSIDEAVLAALLTALWTDQSDGGETGSSGTQ